MRTRIHVLLFCCLNRRGRDTRTHMGTSQSSSSSPPPPDETTVGIDGNEGGELAPLVVTVRSPPHFLEEWKAAALLAHDSIGRSPDHRAQRDQLLRTIAEYKVTIDARITELKQYILQQQEEERIRQRIISPPIPMARYSNRESALYAVQHGIEPTEEDDDDDDCDDDEGVCGGNDADRIVNSFVYIPESPQASALRIDRLVHIIVTNPHHGLLQIDIPTSAYVCRLNWQTIRTFNAILRTLRARRDSDTTNLGAAHAFFGTLLTKAAFVTTHSAASCWLAYQPWHEIAASDTIHAWNGQPLSPESRFQQQQHHFWNAVKHAQTEGDSPRAEQQLPVDTFDTTDAYYCGRGTRAYRQVAVHQMRVQNWFDIRRGLRELADDPANHAFAHATTLRILCKAIELFCDRATSHRWGLQIFAHC